MGRENNSVLSIGDHIDARAHIGGDHIGDQIRYPLIILLAWIIL